MARTIASIYAEIAADKDNQTSLVALAPEADSEQQLLAALNATSKVAVWRLWAYITAVAIHLHEVLWDAFRIEVAAQAARAVVGTAAWYQRMVLAYQHGDGLTYNATTGGYGYEVINESQQVVKRCAVVEGADSVLTLKVAGLDGAGNPVALTTAHQNGLSSYVTKMRFAGTRYTIVSGNGDILRVAGNVFYDAARDAATLQTQVQVAVERYVSQLPFNGQFLLSKLEDAIQSVDGVEDVQLVSVQTKTLPGGTYTAIARAHVPLYGYYQIDSTAGNTLADTLTYLAA